ncbi:folate/biopterin family MFS transporter [Brasilonema sp. UFV-L1]|uniref:folate/biopterin family MFS transporter n=1 Tax=Brasilonema sp. UFV-L1 TaxID=2234130 RepID=UPI00145CCF63|nr:folate/biopterin family MFS transporter [Brasilonema sp. UFV-L1]NMG10510.1 folate/biopterin family MFS transporter [Brasilonema sp. UFV-L1]
MLISSSGLSKVKNSVREKVFFGNEPTAELFAILTVYFVQGILGLARLAVSFFLKDELGLTPAQASALFGIVFLPWTLKTLYGLISDGLPICGYRRRPYLILSGMLGTIAWASLATIVHTPIAATIALALTSLSVAGSDVIVDSIVVAKVRTESQARAGSLQSLCWVSSALGGLITAYLSGVLLELFTTRTIFWITASFPLLVSGTAWLIAEVPVSKDASVNDDSNFVSIRHQLQQLRAAVTQKAIWLPTAFIFLLHATPTAESAFFFFTTNELHFEPEFLGRVHLVTSIAALVGVWIFQRFLKTVPFRVIFAWTTVLSAVLGMTMLILVTHTNRALGIDDHWFSLGDSLILTVMGRIAFLPVLVLGAKLCPPGVEATLFALLMSVYNLGGIVSYQFGAVLMYWLGITETNFNALWLLVIIANLSRLLPLLFINWLPAADSQSETEQASLPEFMSELMVQQPGSEPIKTLNIE